MLLLRLLLLTGVTSALLAAPTPPVDKMDVWRSGVRGANTAWKRNAAELRVLREGFGANVARLLGNTTPLRAPAAPHAFLEANWALLHRVCDDARQVGLYVVIDPHTTPGTAKPTTTNPQDAFWKDSRYQDFLADTWRRLAHEFKGRPEVIGYDLLNEPAILADAPAGSPGDWNVLVKRLIKVIRAEDPDTPIVIEPPVVLRAGKRVYSRISGLEYLALDWGDDRVVYSPHIYEPHPFTHQGVNNLPFGPSYPGCVTKERAADGSVREVTWDRAELERVLAPAIRFAGAHHAVIFFGEFSANRQAAGGDRYVQDLVSLFEQAGFSWAYHSFREAAVWDSELGSDPKNRTPLPHAPRAEILRAAMTRNQAFLPAP